MTDDEMTDDEMIKHASRAQLQEMLRVALKINADQARMLDAYREMLGRAHAMLNAQHAQLEATRPAVLRAHVTQHAVTQPRGGKRPWLDCWLDDKLWAARAAGHDTSAKELRRALEREPWGELRMEGDYVCEPGRKPMGVSGFGKRLTAAKKRLTEWEKKPAIPR